MLHSILMVVAIAVTAWTLIGCVVAALYNARIDYRSPWFLILAVSWLAVYFVR